MSPIERTCGACFGRGVNKRGPCPACNGVGKVWQPPVKASSDRGAEEAVKKRRVGNPVGSKWRSTPKDLRKRPQIGVTISPEAHQALEELARSQGTSRSQVIEVLVLEAWSKLAGV